MFCALANYLALLMGADVVLVVQLMARSAIISSVLGLPHNRLNAGPACLLNKTNKAHPLMLSTRKDMRRGEESEQNRCTYINKTAYI